jgi:prepilin-type N-terminal cleavage/methylation domain-containing protein
MRKKLRAQCGLTLVEMLITILLMSIAGGIIASVIDLAVKHYDKLMKQSDAQLLCSAVSVFVQNELTYASDIDVDDSKVTFTDHANDLGSGCELAADTNGHMVVKYSGGVKSIGDGAYGGDASSKDFKAVPEFSRSGDYIIVTIKINGKVNGVDGTTITENTFSIKPVAPSYVTTPSP